MAAVLGKVEVAVSGVRVVEDVEEPALRVIGGERHREKARLAREPDLASEVEERDREQLSVADHTNEPGLVDDEDSTGVSWRRRHEDRPLGRPDPIEHGAA
jgi:hypothetical protein